VTFSDQWAVTNVEEILSLLRYFGYERELAAVRDATPTDRPALWRAFWQRTDPNPVTPENERLAQYFRRVQEANQRFREAGEAGWTTERGEVYITLGEPDEVFEGSMEFQGTGRTVRWNFVRQQLVLDFVDDTGFGRYRLTPRSRAEFERARNELWSDR
jgi:GWxTD domain-containing protein